MASPNDKPLKITLDDIASIVVPEPVTPGTQPITGVKSYGTITEAAEQLMPVSEERGSILLQGWFYLGVAGLLGAIAGWAIAEPGFVDGKGGHWGNFLMLPSIVTLMCFGFAMAESAVERSMQKALLRGVLSLPLGFILGFFFDLMANLIYNVGLSICYQAGAQSFRNPAVWKQRGSTWTILDFLIADWDWR